MESGSEFEDYFRVFRDIIRLMHSMTNLQEVLEFVVIKITEVLNAKGALLRLLNKETNHFEVRSTCGIGKRYLAKGPVTSEKVMQGPVREGKIHIISDIWHAPRVEYPQQAWDEGIRMMLDVPLSINGEMMGVIRIYLAEPRRFSEAQLDFLITVAEQCACIIERVRLMENQQIQYNHLATQLEKMTSLGRMAAGIAHEINNPLAGILLYSSNLIKKVPHEGPHREGLDIIIRETQRCKGIIQGLLEFSRDNKPQKEISGINSIMEKALGILDNEFRLHRIRIEKNLSDDIPDMLIDENQVEQVFINILMNALQAVDDDDGTIRIQTRVDPDKHVIRVEIADNGCGIGAGHINKIFDPFFTTKSNGTGLGLSVSYGIVRNHGGDIQVASEIGKGTQIVLEFPMVNSGRQTKKVHALNDAL